MTTELAQESAPGWRPRVLVTADHYLPGFRAGGPIRTLSNLVGQLGHEYEFWIVTRDRDLGDAAPYSDVVPGRWHPLGAANVYHARPDELGPAALGKLLSSTSADLLYLNSSFSPRMSILPLVLRRLGRIPHWPVVLAPRGEYSPGALALKPWRKRTYLTVARAVGLLHGLYWQATSGEEYNHIVSTAGAPASRVRIVPNLASAELQRAATTQTAETGQVDAGHFRLVFLSRVSPMKNLDHLLGLLKRVRTPVALSVYGPLGDVAYWQHCKTLAASLPAHVRMEYLGDVPPDKVAGVFGQHDLFAFPTRGENFGHVILESLCAGTPVIVSDRTPWQADAAGGVTVLPLEAVDAWADAIDHFARDAASLRQQRRAAALAVAKEHLVKSRALCGHRALFQAALRDSGACGSESS